jgi:cytidylate kinase
LRCAGVAVLKGLRPGEDAGLAEGLDLRQDTLVRDPSPHPVQQVGADLPALASVSISTCITNRTDSRIRSTPSPARIASSNSDATDWDNAIGRTSCGEYLAVHTENLADGAHVLSGSPTTRNPITPRGLSPWGHHAAAANGDISGGNNWQQIACSGALLAELKPILPPAANRHEVDDGGWIYRQGRHKHSPCSTPRKEVVMTTSSEAGHSPKLVVTLFESYGSGASYVSARVADALGVPVHVQAFSSEEIEAAMSVHESRGLLTRVFNAMGGSYASFAGIEGPNVVMAQEGDNYELVARNTRFVEEAAREGGVIVGRNGAFILADWPGALHVRLDGPLEQRIARAAQEGGIDLEQAAKRQKREDQVRADMSIEFYGWDPRELDRYHLVVNTGIMDLDTCADFIVQAARVKAGRQRES